MPELNELTVNESQYEAIIHREGPALVIAGPGSGKTTVITQRIKYLIEHHQVKPEEILVITFTKAAATEMQSRFFQIMNTESSHVTFGTFHAIYFHILKQAYHYQNKNILTETEKYKFLKEAMQSVEYYSESAQENTMLQSDFMQLILQEISQVKNQGIAIEQYVSQSLDAITFRQIFHRYQRILYENRKLDFDDMVLQCYQLFLQRADILQGWRNRFQYILIDEFQDICPMQFAVIRQLAFPRNNLFIVGDDDQSIYSFRGASPKLMLQFPTMYPDAKTIVLNVNYRCREEILQTSMSLISHNKQRFPKEMISNVQDYKTDNVIRYYQYDEENRQYESMLSYIMEHVKHGGKYADIALLFRTNTGASKMAERCIAFQVPFEMKETIQNIYTRFFAEDIIAYIRFALGNQTRSLFYQIMNKPVRYIQRNALHGEKVTKQELLHYYQDKDYVCRAVEVLWTQFIMLREMSPFAAINFIRKGIGYDSYLENLANEKREELREWMEQLDRIQGLAKDFETLEEWLKYVENYTTQIQKVKKVTGDAVEIMTMHAAKGLEWKQVWIPDLNEGIIPHKKAELPEEVEEERRMLYVALTRAKEKLILSSVICQGDRRYQAEKQQDEKWHAVSRFVKEIGCKSNNFTNKN